MRGKGSLLVLACGLAACGGDTAPVEPDAFVAPACAPSELGGGDHTPASVGFTAIAVNGDGLREPRDLAFNPLRPDELWVVNSLDDSVIIVHDASTPVRTAERRIDMYAPHFMDAPTAIAFGADENTIGFPGTFATCGESRNEGGTSPIDFMGPALWPSALEVFQLMTGMQGSHLDMLHCSPLCMGLAHESANIYWAFGGLSESIVKYDFHTDHGLGAGDHGDGEAYQYVTGELAHVPGVPGHLAWDATTRMLYIADTGHSRIARLDTTTGTIGEPLPAIEPMEAYNQIDGAALAEVVPASAALLSQPSGLELRGDCLYVSDHATGVISAFSLDGQRATWLDTGLGDRALGGLAFGPDDKLYFVDIDGDQVLRVDP